MTVTYTVGDTREAIKGIPDGSVDLVATSPPFYQLRSYVPNEHDSKHQEIGSEPDPATFIDTLLELTAEWGRVLAPHGSIAVELGDTYSGSGGGGGDYLPGGMRDGQPAFGGSARASNAAHWRAKNVQTGSPRAGAKSLVCIPDLYTIALAYGINPLTGNESPAGKWLVRNKIVWHRPNPAVGALGDKVRPSTSYIVVATRSPKRWFDLTAVRTEPTGVNYGRQAGWNNVAQKGQTANGAQRDGEYRPYSDPAGAPPLDAWFDPYDGTHDTWTLTTQPSKLAHYAMWPAKLAERLILSMCPSQVCRVCGEPRRRMEGKTPEYQLFRDAKNALARAEAGSRLAAQHGGGFDGWSNLDDSAARGTTNLTLGWSDCGHAHYRPGLVLDPFCGSGTTMCAAELHGRDAIGIDFDSRNRDLYPRRMEEVRRALFGTQPELPGQLGMFDGVPA